MLSAICLEEGVEHVTAVDVNETMVNLAARNLRELDPSRKRHQGLHAVVASDAVAAVRRQVV